MKFKAMFSAVALVMTGWAGGYAQVADAEVPGDHFSLEGALELFKKSSSPEEFERLLNDADSKVNNLDLNGDGYIDYIRVFNRQDGNVHIFVLQAVVSPDESQDIAVIELEKKADGKAVLQIVGDPDIYGIETIIEPTSEVRTYAGTRSEPVVVNVWTWPVVRYVYSPRYVVYHSPWGWHHRPVWWRPWRPVVYVDYYSYWQPYYVHYSFCHTRRVHYAYNIYRPYRTTSVIIVNKYRPQVERYRTRYSDGHPRRESRSTSGYADRGRDSGRSRAQGDSYNDGSRDSRAGRPGSRSAEDRGERGNVEGRTTERPTLINNGTRTSGQERSGTRSGSASDANVMRRSEASGSSGGNDNPAPRRQRSEVRSGGDVQRSNQRQVVTGTRPSTPAVSPSRSPSPSQSPAPSRSIERREQPAAQPSRSAGSSRPAVTPNRSSGNNRTTVSPGRQSPPSASPSRERPSRPARPAGSRSGNN